MNSKDPLVIDLGSGICKAGIAGEEAPVTVFPTIIGENDENGSTPIGYEARQSLYHHPIEHGVVKNWDDVEKIFNKVFYTDLQISPEEHSVLLTQPVHNPKTNKEKLAELMFETYNVPALYQAIDSVLCIYASGRHAGIVLQIGDGVTSITPIEGVYPMTEAIIRTDIGGRDLTDFLRRKLKEAGHFIDEETAREIKEKCCYIAMDNTNGYTNNNQETTTHKLPDGNTITLENDALTCTEALFTPSMINKYESTGIHDMVYSSIMKCSIDSRILFANNIILAGGSTMFSGIEERLTNELQSRVPSKMGVKILDGDVLPALYTVWIGGSIMASLSSFEKACLTKAEYEESGSSVIHKKFFYAIH